MAKGKSRRSADPFVKEMAEALAEGRRDDTVILFIPSHDKNQKALPDQDQWADVGLRLFGKLFRGATAFRALRGIWVTEDGRELFDEPIMIQCLAGREDVENEVNLQELVEFSKRMCRDTNQECVAIIVNDVIHFVTVH